MVDFSIGEGQKKKLDNEIFCIRFECFLDGSLFNLCGVGVNVLLYSSSGLPQTAHLRTAPSSGKVHGMLLRSNSVPRKKAVPFVNIPLSDGQVLNSNIFFIFVWLPKIERVSGRWMLELVWLVSSLYHKSAAYKQNSVLKYVHFLK